MSAELHRKPTKVGESTKEAMRRAEEGLPADLDQWDLLDWSIWNARQDEFNAREKLSKGCGYLSERLAEVKKRMEDASWTPNSLGEVQGSGLDIDRACAEVDSCRKIVKKLESLREKMPRTAIPVKGA